jgi:flagellar FliL protein
MSDEEQAVKPKRKGRKALFAGLLVLILGGGGAGALYASNAGLLGGHGPAAPDVPHLVPRDGVPDSEAARYASPTGEGKVDPAKFQASYHPLGDNITANLRDGAGFIQIGLGVSTYYDERVIQNVTQHEMAIRSAVLVALTDQDAEAIATPSGKEALKSTLRASINDVLKKKAGFGGIDDVHFTSFVIQ